MDGTQIREWLARMSVSTISQWEGLELASVVLEGDAGDPDRLAPAAISAGDLVIQEDGQGTVPHVLAVHVRGPEVLVLDGEILVGCKQNRVVVHTVIIPVGSSLRVPVGCVEQGRWRASTPSFESGDMRAEPWLRKHRLDGSPSRSSAGDADAIDQAQLWSEVTSRFAAEGRHSPTADYHDLLGWAARSQRASLSRFKPEDGQVGLVVTRGGRLLGIEVFSHPETFAQAVVRTLPTYAMSAAMADDDAQGELESRSAADWLDAARSVEIRTKPGIGEGTEFEISGDAWLGRGVFHQSRVRHLAVFPGK